ncbi:ANK1 [Symbiodinium sp. CCMP2456]|nr:ANK1 [Symbiodinium sp. CCMP2456]
MFRNVAYIQFCLLVAALGTADTAGHVPVTTEDEPIACPVGMGALRKALAFFDLKDPSRLVDMAVSSFLPDLMALLAAALFFYFLNLVLVEQEEEIRSLRARLDEAEVKVRATLIEKEKEAKRLGEETSSLGQGGRRPCGLKRSWTES